MTVLTGLFAQLPGIENLSADEIIRWLNKSYDPKVIENYLGNRVIYPQSIALTNEEKLIDRAIIQEYISKNPSFFYNPLSHRILVPLELLHRIQPTTDLMIMLCSLLQIQGVAPIFIGEETSIKNEGAVMAVEPLTAEKNISILINGKETVVENNKIYHFSVEDQHIKVKVDGANEIMIQGGKLGLTIDLRKKTGGRM